MNGSDNPQPKKPIPPKQVANNPRKPLQVMHISRKAIDASGGQKDTIGEDEINIPKDSSIKAPIKANKGIEPASSYPSKEDLDKELASNQETGITMADLLRDPVQRNKDFPPKENINSQIQIGSSYETRSVDDFDFNEEAFLAALNENEPIGNTGEIAKGLVIEVESDGVYVDIGGKAPGFMPKKECGLGVITNLKEKFPKGLEVEVLVTREQNADGMVTISSRALALRKSWDKVKSLEKEGKIVKIKINGFNRGGVTFDLEGLRGFIPRSHLENGESPESLVGKTIGAAFLEVNPETRKLVLSEKKATTTARFNELKIGQLIEGKVLAIKPYGFFIDLGGISGLLHQSMTTNGSIRSLREIFHQGEAIKAIITDLDPGRGRIGLNTALLEGPPGELLTDKEKIMKEAEERALKARNTINQDKINKNEINQNNKDNTQEEKNDMDKEETENQ